MELLVNCNDRVPGVLEVNSTNKIGLTALDLFILCPCESGISGSETMRLLLGRLGAVRFQDSHTVALAAPVNPNSTTGDRDVSLRREEIISWESYFQFQVERDNPSSVRDALLVVAVLMATATYQAALTPPVRTSHSSSFVWFMVANSLGFVASLNMIDILTYDFPLKLELFVTAMAMGASKCNDHKCSTRTHQARLHLALPHFTLSICNLQIHESKNQATQTEFRCQ